MVVAFPPPQQISQEAAGNRGKADGHRKRETRNIGSNDRTMVSSPTFEKRRRFRYSPTLFQRPEYLSDFCHRCLLMTRKCSALSRGVRSGLIASLATPLWGSPADSWLRYVARDSRFAGADCRQGSNPSRRLEREAQLKLNQLRRLQRLPSFSQ